jgi:hypothetical protein
MSQRLDSFNWSLLGDILGAAVQTREGAELYKETISLLWPRGRQLLVHENGGEFNATVREPDGRVWEPDFSVAYTMWGARINHDTMAYRILCLLGARQIDYHIDLDVWPTQRGAAVALRVVADFADLAAQNLTQVDVPVLLADFASAFLAKHEIHFRDAFRSYMKTAQIDVLVAEVYAAAKPDRATALKTAVSAAEVVRDPFTDFPKAACRCQRKGGHVVGIVCLFCQLQRGPLLLKPGEPP